MELCKNVFKTYYFSTYKNGVFSHAKRTCDKRFEHRAEIKKKDCRFVNKK